MQPTILKSTATILHFPLRGRFVPSAPEISSPGDAPLPSSVPLPDFGGCWYHETAILEDDKNRNPR